MPECRPLSVSMGSAIHFVKNRIANLPITLTESEAKAALQSDIKRFISEKIVAPDKAIVRHAVTKIRDGDVLLTYGSPTAVEMVLLQAHELRKKFRVLVVDSRPKLEGYDATLSDYISMIITDYGMVPPTSVPVIVREYQKEHLLV
ncbi:unnamed protein product [Eruca vesicaria subsp. sativa]|uniref:Translation initiation factor eIF2B subunit delta n=1 Tax=Eruca vesicaria subsp. sativa TaxID=29727 RepID=A0ABC8K961_ERUVS|nr:unnamed protein product [Eruca vesicaria subsp. sativa]